MHLLDLTLPTPEANLALDEALLEEVEAGRSDELLRLWEAPQPLVVIGRSSKIDEEVNRDYCQREGIPVLRRCSGGAAVVAGPGCLMYAVILRHDLRPGLRALDDTHRYVMERTATAVRQAVGDVEVAGISDLAVGPQRQKFSGNSLRCKRDSFLYHGTILYDFPLKLIDACLDVAPRQPKYRDGRDHRSFVTNLPADPTALRGALCKVWEANDPLAAWPQEHTEQLVHQRYSTDKWNCAR